jgi:hypothetical protein
MPVVHMPMPRVILCMCVTLVASSSLSGTFFCVTTHTASAPRTASDVRATLFTALNAYSTCEGASHAAAREMRARGRVGARGRDSARVA